MRNPADCHPDQPNHARGQCHPCYRRDYAGQRRNLHTPPGWRPLIDLDLGHACQYGYHQPPVRVVAGGPGDDWNSPARLAAAAVDVLADGPRTTTELGDALGLTPTERQYRLLRGLARMARRGEVRRWDRPGKATIWGLAA